MLTLRETSVVDDVRVFRQLNSKSLTNFGVYAISIGNRKPILTFSPAQL